MAQFSAMPHNDVKLLCSTKHQITVVGAARRVFWYDRAVGLGDLGIIAICNQSAVEPAGRPDFRHVEFD
jgi:hypothetical protein